MPSRQTIWNRRQDLARLQAFATDGLRVSLAEGRGYLLTTPDGGMVFGPYRHEVAFAFVVGYRRGRGDVTQLQADYTEAVRLYRERDAQAADLHAMVQAVGPEVCRLALRQEQRAKGER